MPGVRGRRRTAIRRCAGGPRQQTEAEVNWSRGMEGGWAGYYRRSPRARREGRNERVWEPASGRVWQPRRPVLRWVTPAGGTRLRGGEAWDGGELGGDEDV